MSTQTRHVDPWLPAEFSIAEEAVDETGIVLIVQGELDIVTAPELRERLNAVIERGAERVVVDLTDVEFLDSVSLAVLVCARKRLGGRLATIVAPDSYSRLIFQIAGVGNPLGVVETREQALESARS
jgi:anti-sigma B factor antagonist